MTNETVGQVTPVMVVMDFHQKHKNAAMINYATTSPSEVRLHSKMVWDGRETS